jgi:hypothetical protein
LFDNIVGFKFEPGHTFETCHHGMSPLSLSMRSFADQEQESQDDDYFAQATNKTPEAVRKHNLKLPPPLPSSVGELSSSSSHAPSCLRWVYLQRTAHWPCS